MSLKNTTARINLTFIFSERGIRY